MGRSVLAIVIGFVFIGALSFTTDALVRAALPGAFDVAGGTTSVPVLVLTLAYVGLFAVAGCYLAARLAPGRPMTHALVLGGLGLLFNIAGTVATWATAPAWYHAVALALVLPYAWLGGHLRQRQVRGGPSAQLPAA
jgi:hypothetical protein